MPNMGIQANTKTPAPGLADALFSGTRQRLIGLLFGQVDRSFYATELIGLTKSGSGAVQRELVSMAQSGLLTVRAVGNQKHYQANPNSPIFEELSGIARKTIGLADPLREALAPLSGKIKAAFVYGSIAKRTDAAGSDIDVLLLSNELAYADVFAALEAASSTLGRPVNPTVLTSAELRKRLESEESFLTRVLAQPKIWLIGGKDALTV